MGANERQRLAWALVLFGISFCVTPIQADEGVIRTGCYVFEPVRSTIVQTGGFAGVDWTYAVEGQFCLVVDPNAEIAWFARVDANAVDVNEPVRTLDPNAVFNLTGLVGEMRNDGFEFIGQTPDGSTAELTLTFTDDTVHLSGGTTPPPNSADFFVFAIDAIAARKYAGGTGEPNTPYLIATAEQMNAIGTCPEDWDKHFQLTADIDLSHFDGKGGRPTFNIIASDTNSEAWGFQGTPFVGVFDGGDYTVASLNWSGSATDYVGLFGYVSGPNAEIRNLGLIEPIIYTNGGTRVGALVGKMTSGTIRNCYTKDGSAFGSTYVGGLVGEILGGAITACYSATEVSGENGVGGLIGRGKMVTVNACHADTQVNGSWHVGGLVGDSSGFIEDSYATNNVGGDRYVGGLVGFNWGEYVRVARPGDQSTFVLCGGRISNCHATGSISGDEGVGGLVGRMWEGSVTQSYATASISGNYRIGVLIGLSEGEVVSCYSAGEVTGGNCVGGLVGENWRSISNCYSGASVVGLRDIGGLVGCNAGLIQNCYSLGVVSGELRVGGLTGSSDWMRDEIVVSFWNIETSGQPSSPTGTGLTTAQMQTAATYLDAGWDFVGETSNGTDGVWWILEGQDYPRLWWERDDEASL